MILSDHSFEYEGHTVNYLVLGDKSQAIKLFFTKQSNGYLIRINEKRNCGLDIAFNNLKEGSEVNFWRS